MFEHSLINLVNFPFHVMSSALAVWNENDFKRYIFPDLKVTEEHRNVAINDMKQILKRFWKPKGYLGASEYYTWLQSPTEMFRPWSPDQPSHKKSFFKL